MSDTLYMQLDANIPVHHPHVCLQDIAKLSCSDPKILNRLRVLPITVLPADKPGRYVFSALELIKIIQKKEPSLELVPLGEPTFILTYCLPSTSTLLNDWIKIVFVCLVSFFGAAFSIMTFNNDVDLPALFQQIHTLVTGNPSSGFSALEISYSLGLGLGVLFFFNHFGRLRLTDDPTPMQVQMRQYEDNVNNTIIEEIERTGQKSKESRFH